MTPFRLLLSLLGVSLLWSTRLAYGGQRRIAAEDPSLLTLNIAAWTLILMGILLSGSLPLLLVALVVGASVVWKYRSAECRTLIRTLAAAAQRDIPLPQAAAAYAEGRTDEMGRRATRLSQLLTQGVSLPKALKMVRLPIPMDLALAVNRGYVTNSLGDTLIDALESGDGATRIRSAILERSLYISFLVVQLLAISVFLAVKIEPTYRMILQDFDLQLYPFSTAVFQTIQYFVQHPFVSFGIGAPFLLLIPLATLYGTLSYIGVPLPELPWSQRIFGRIDTAFLLRELGKNCRQGSSVIDSLQLLQHTYPNAQVGAQLAKTVGAIQQGQHWSNSLHDNRLIPAADLAILKSAEGSGNLAWALTETAEAAERRIEYRGQLVTRILAPILLVCLSIPIAMMAVAYIAPLLQLVQAISKSD